LEARGKNREESTIRVYFLPFSAEPGSALAAFCLIIGGWWCVRIIGRRHRDLEQFREGDRTQRIVIVVFWGLTLIIIALMVLSAVYLAPRIIQAWAEWYDKA
jgi:sterol desaturase/sphingolipid hydroxylase (fatty acid hydroxylase superfamily)